MDESATGVRERRRQRTADALVSLARRATAAEGLHGFTVEELCEQAGVSRRTFFNYFASKEDAVLGVALNSDLSGVEELFVAKGRAHRLADATDGLTPTLVDDLAALVVARVSTMELSPETIAELGAALDREPRLLTRMLDRAAQTEREDALLIAEREGLADDDLRAQTVALLVGALARASVMEYVGTPTTDSFPDIFERRVAAARAVLAPAHPTEGRP
jgi:AcrR family transcriptional regulator